MTCDTARCRGKAVLLNVLSNSTEPLKRRSAILFADCARPLQQARLNLPPLVTPAAPRFASLLSGGSFQ